MSRFALDKIWVKITQKRVKQAYDTSVHPWRITRQMGDAYLQCETLIIAYFLLIFWGIFHYIVLLIVLLWHSAPTLLPRSVFPLLFLCKSREEKKHGGGWLRGCTVQPGGLLFPWFFVDFDITGRGCVCVCFEVFIALIVFLFPLLAVNVVVCPIIYLLLVWFVYWLIVWRIVLIYDSIYANIKSMLTNSVGLCECGWVCVFVSPLFGFCLGRRHLST